MAKSPKFAVVSPIGRIVEGDPFKPQTHDSNGQLRVYKTGPNVGQPNPQYYIGLAVPKLINGQPNQDWASFHAFVWQVASAAWPNLFQNGQCIRQDFAWKIRDGDGFSKEGKNLSEKPGFAGHWIVSFSSSFAPQVVVETSPGVYAELTNEEAVKRGYYVRIGASVSGNDSTQTPGIYMNLDKIELKGLGEVIATGQSAAETFRGAAAGAVPEGMGALNPAMLAAAPSGMGAQAGQAPMAQPGFAAPGAPMGQPGFAAAPAPAPAPMAVQPGMAGGFAAPAPMAAPGVPMGQPAAMMAAPGNFQGPAPQPAPGAPGAPGVGAPSATPSPAAPGFANPATGMMTSPSSPAPAPAPAPAAYSGFMGARVMLPAAQGVPYESFIQQGWTDETLIAHGMMAAQ